MNHRKPRICLLIGHFLPVYSGASLQAFRLLKQLRLNGYSVCVLTLLTENLAASEMIDGIAVRRIRKPAGDWTPSKVLVFWVRLFFCLVRERKNFDILHVVGAHLQLSVAGPIAWLLRKKSLVKLTLARSDLDKLNTGRWGKLQRQCLDRIDRYISISKEITAELQASPLDQQKILEIPNGVDTTLFRPWESEDARQKARKDYHFENEPLALYVGILNQRKGIDLLIEAWHRAKVQHSPGRLLLVGPEANTAPDFFSDKIKRMIALHQLADSIIFWGQEQDVAGLMRACDLLILPSRSEGMPNVVLEAMASGLPVLASNAAGTEIVIESGREGLIFNIDDVEDFAQKLMRLLTRRSLRQELGQAARQRIEGAYSLEIITRRYQELYQQLTGELQHG
jgi:glycosyltransferase involved in cell wall biosynthesis